MSHTDPVIRHAAIGFLLVGLFVLWPRTATPHNPVTTTVLFNREIATLFNRKCMQCHASGKLAMPLGTFAEARPWAQAIKEEALARRMPPWPAQRGVGNFANDVGLTQREFDFLISWVDGGTPEGDGTPPEFVDHGVHWMLGEPDHLLVAPAGVGVPAHSSPQLRRIVIDTGLTRDSWLKGFDYKPGDGRVVRAAFLSVAGTDQFIGGWTPWAPTMELPDGLGIKIAAGAQLAVDVLYQSLDVDVTDLPRIGLYLVDQPAREVHTDAIAAVAPTRTVMRDSELLSLRVEAAPGTRSLELRARRPNGSIEPLLRIKEIRQQWQTPFIFAKPVRLPKGTVIQAIATTASRSAAADFTIELNSAPAP
jgi:hypothetical protein